MSTLKNIIMKRKILVFEDNIALGLDITWKLGHLGWDVAWLKDLHQISEAIKSAEMVLYSLEFANKSSEFTTYLRYFEDNQIPISLIPNPKHQFSALEDLSDQSLLLDYPFTLSNLNHVLEDSLKRMCQKNDFNQEADLLKRIIKIKDQAIHMTVHEIRTPISIIHIAIKNLEHVLQTLKIEDHEILDIQIAFQEIQDIVNTLENMTLDSLYLGQSKIQEIEIYSLCKQVISTFYSSLPIEKRDQTKISLQTSHSEFFVLVDSNLFKIALKNLISNAIKFSPNRPKILITLETTGKEFKLCVYDRGIGIQEEDLCHVTKPFYRSQNAIDFSGNGLGLSIVESCISCQNGRLKIQSQLGTGTCVTVFLPIKIV
jgi:signal transduction histidine kinase